MRTTPIRCLSSSRSAAETAIAELFGDWDAYRDVDCVYRRELVELDPWWADQPEVADQRISRGLSEIGLCRGLRLYADGRRRGGIS